RELLAGRGDALREQDQGARTAREAVERDSLEPQAQKTEELRRVQGRCRWAQGLDERWARRGLEREGQAAGRLRARGPPHAQAVEELLGEEAQDLAIGDGIVEVEALLETLGEERGRERLLTRARSELAQAMCVLAEATAQPGLGELRELAEGVHTK